MMMNKKSGLGLKDLATSSNSKCLSLLHASSNLIGFVKGASPFSNAYYLLYLREERCGRKISGVTPTAPNLRD